MKILFEDNDIIVCIKPAGILSQADSGGAQTALSILSEHCGSEVFPVHRLDRETAGVMVYAKNKSSAAALSEDIAAHRFVKEYIALVHGIPTESRGEMRDLLFKDSTRNKSYVVKRARKGVKEAVLEYTVIGTKAVAGLTVSKVLIRLHTGRTHQIRVQFASRGFPLTGDRKYGARDDFLGLGLWSYKITFFHPSTGQELSFSAEPENFV